MKISPELKSHIENMLNERKLLRDAADADFQKQNSYERAYDRRLGFLSGVRWAFNTLLKLDTDESKVGANNRTK